MPVVTIISVALNNIPGIRVTVESVLNQDFSEWELLFVVANSIDGSGLEVQQLSNIDQRIKLVEQETLGIYDAMNLGVEKSRGRYLVFLNSGDRFHRPESLGELVHSISTTSSSIVIGGYKLIGSNKVYVKKASLISAPKFALNIRGGCHQAMIFQKNSVISHSGYDTGIRLAADFDLVLRMLAHSDAIRLSETVCEIEPNGISHTRIREVLRQKNDIRFRIFGRFSFVATIGRIQNIAVLVKISIRRTFELNQDSE